MPECAQGFLYTGCTYNSSCDRDYIKFPSSLCLLETPDTRLRVLVSYQGIAEGHAYLREGLVSEYRSKLRQ